MNESICVEAWDEDFVKDKLIGVGEFSLKEFTHLDSELCFDIALFDKKKKTTGRIKAFARLEKSPSKEIEFVETSFVEGTFYIKRIRAIGLKNVELFGEIDPYIVCTLGDIEYRTNVLDNAVRNSNISNTHCCNLYYFNENS